MTMKDEKVLNVKGCLCSVFNACTSVGSLISNLAAKLLKVHTDMGLLAGYGL